jgi:hypothetical protein
MKAGAKGAPKDAAGLEGQALDVMKRYGGHIQTAASLQNQQNAIGNAFLESLQKLQKSALNINKSFEDVAKKPVDFLATGIKDLTDSIRGLTTSSDAAATSLGRFAP